MLANIPPRISLRVGILNWVELNMMLCIKCHSIFIINAMSKYAPEQVNVGLRSI